MQRPPRELKGFVVVEAEPGRIDVAASSRDIRSSVEVVCPTATRPSPSTGIRPSANSWPTRWPVRPSRRR
ncbi:hypothetical protein [Acidipropionibacterium acidipropionici]|uniref:hypothetical protein n=1 Tax=Acidipropionibacterium acidipropionici TaxID=1748 RepID=UPI001E54113B|nr:hypothetical protein [Acidipropionibacterium acidipropionici]